MNEAELCDLERRLRDALQDLAPVIELLNDADRFDRAVSAADARDALLFVEHASNDVEEATGAVMAALVELEESGESA